RHLLRKRHSTAVASITAGASATRSRLTPHRCFPQSIVVCRFSQRGYTDSDGNYFIEGTYLGCEEIGDGSGGTGVGGGGGGQGGGGFGGGRREPPSTQAQRCFDCQHACVARCDAVRSASQREANTGFEVEIFACFACAVFGPW